MPPNPMFSNPQVGDLCHDMSFSDNGFSVDKEEEKYRDDSGIDCEEAPLELPDAELIERIVQQVEALFSDENLVRDEFMAKNMRKNRGGFVNLKLVASLRKVKIITKDWRIVAHAIQVASSRLELNENGTKVRRKQLLHPVDSGSKYDRTVFVINLPQHKEDIDQLHHDFAIFGRIGLIRIIRPNSKHPSHAKMLSHIARQVPLLKEDQLVGAVEFNRVVDAQACLEQQHRLIAFDPTWKQVSLCIVKKSESSCQVPRASPAAAASPPSTPPSQPSGRNQPAAITLPQLGSHVISKPAENQVLVITVTSSSVTLTTVPHKEHLCPAGSSVTDTQQAQRQPGKVHSSIIRQPRGPDGTRGFRYARQ